jgi:hypothetical protein
MHLVSGEFGDPVSLTLSYSSAGSLAHGKRGMKNLVASGEMKDIFLP